MARISNDHGIIGINLHKLFIRLKYTLRSFKMVFIYPAFTPSSFWGVLYPAEQGGGRLPVPDYLQKGRDRDDNSNHQPHPLERGKILDTVTASAILDRLSMNGRFLTFEGRSFRSKR